jgi:hypothetical protein
MRQAAKGLERDYGFVSWETDFETKIMCRSFEGVLLRSMILRRKRREGFRIVKREVNHDSIPVKASTNPAGSSESYSLCGAGQGVQDPFKAKELWTGNRIRCHSNPVTAFWS